MSHAADDSLVAGVGEAVAPDGSPLRVLFLATYFPKPGNPMMGVWALKQAHALRDAGADVRVVSFTSYIPRILARAGARLAAWANCPPAHAFDGLPVAYPRWMLYQVGRLKARAYVNPGPQMALAWRTARRGARRVMNDFRPHVVFAHHSAVNGHIAWRLQREFGVPYVTTDWDFAEIADCGHLPKRRAFIGRVMRDAAAAVAVANRMEADMRRLFPEARRIVTIHNGVPPLPTRLWDQPRPAELDGKTVVFSAGLFYSRKGIPLLVEAFASVAKRHPEAVLRIAGDGADRPIVQEIIRRHGIAEQVTLLGMQPHERVAQEMVWADLFMLIGWDEPFATVYMEAMAAGNPIICANDGGVNDVLVDGVHGRSVPPRDVPAAAAALDAVLSDAAARRRMGEAAASLFRDKLTSQQTARALLRIFGDALREAAPVLAHQ
jgi:glycosyltransferase involved in cell wall biosynthesis